MVMAIIALCRREPEIDEAFKLWKDTAQDDHRLVDRKARLDNLLHQKWTLQFAGGQSPGPLFSNPIGVWATMFSMFSRASCITMCCEHQGLGHQGLRILPKDTQGHHGRAPHLLSGLEDTSLH